MIARIHPDGTVEVLGIEIEARGPVHQGLTAALRAGALVGLLAEPRAHAAAAPAQRTRPVLRSPTSYPPARGRPAPEQDDFDDLAEPGELEMAPPIPEPEEEWDDEPAPAPAPTPRRKEAPRSEPSLAAQARALRAKGLPTRPIGARPITGGVEIG